MTRKQALTDLLAKVEAGVWPDDTTPIGEISYEAQVYLMQACDGSLDAAKALHEAVLPGWGCDISSEEGASVYNFETSYKGLDSSECPARAWLIAIIKALIAEEKS